MTRILIARHGNTFSKGEIPLRIGQGTDLPLSKSGREQAKKLGQYLAAHYPDITAVFCSELQRTRQTAELVLMAGRISVQVREDKRFNEVDYGVDEGKPEEQVITRIGLSALKAWDEEAIVPPGWLLDPTAVVAMWQTFAMEILASFSQQTILVITSNGIARFAPYLTGDVATFKKNYVLKMSTGAVSSLIYTQDVWQIEYWDKGVKSRQKT